MSVLIEFPANYLASLFIENERVGRKNLIGYSYLLCSISCFLCFIQEEPDEIFFFLISAVKFFISVAFTVVYPFTNELYPTHLRATGLSCMSAACRIGGIVMPYIVNLFFIFGPTGPFLAIGAVSLISCFATFSFPSDTANMELDTYHLSIFDNHIAK